ncbi:uncharacterized protein LOC114530726 [Dendronephthya gigantea]|uniref:uncharacterized protein LOC114530726 n=1 Tax=Dendronephthya gigantea TaxID=151771 RepID=UPI00106BE633|nr:uncharacterized protein LOC114530726 [Dendronephthya gigantea]
MQAQIPIKCAAKNELAMEVHSRLVRNCTTVLAVLAFLFTIVAGDQRLLNNRTCTPAEAEPTLNSSSCYPLVNLSRPFCQNHGITLAYYVYSTPANQIKRNKNLNSKYDVYKNIGAAGISLLIDVNITTVKKCMDALSVISCHYLFPSCDGTRSVFSRQYICRETCIEAKQICGKIWEMLGKKYSIKSSKSKSHVRCELQPYRNAGDSPECWYDDLLNSTDSSTVPDLSIYSDCLHLHGSSYRGEISVTASGTPCQSWTEQCPHRHTMNTTYPELNNAKNYCRNPQNSGQRPWCFTTDRNKRWEYCDIPKCKPVDGKYGKWSLNSTCNVTCGEGFEIWTRKCNNPEPKHGGKNCSHLGEPIENRRCITKPCPVDGKYGKWFLKNSCNVTCGESFKIWTRKCDNPEPKHGGRNCSHLGESIKFKPCILRPCLGEKKSEKSFESWTIFVTAAGSVFVIAVALIFFNILRRRRRNKANIFSERWETSYTKTTSEKGFKEVVPSRGFTMILSADFCGSAAALIIIIIMILGSNAADERHLQNSNRTCISAEAEPTLNASSCYPLVSLKRPFCQNHGIILSNYVYNTPINQVRRNDDMNSDYDKVTKIGATKISRYFAVNITTVKRCIKALSSLFCHYYFPSCDGTLNVYKRQYICRESCLKVTQMCGNILKVLEQYFIFKFPKKMRLVSCELQPYRNAGDSPECWYYNEGSNSTDSSEVSEYAIDADCLHLNGSSYRGEISVTASGIPCQSWTEQCPHRHTMNTTYPELNNAKNYCRNPKNSGQRPWCFTTDRNKRWEYCDIPKCTPVDGKYGKWSLSSTCNVTCGEGFEIWTRKCNNPEPRHGGRNCSHLGEPIEKRPCIRETCPGERYYQNNNSTCTPAEAEPTLKGSSCYPLENFKRPFCQNHGITLSNYIYNTPAKQVRKNRDMNADYDKFTKMDKRNISIFFKVNVTTVENCVKALGLLFCHYYLPSCDRTQSVYKRQFICRESCLDFMHICGNIWKILERFLIFQHPEMAKLVSCELQPYRNAGDSPECWYYNEFSSSTDSSKVSELDIYADCLYLNGSSYDGNISVTASGIPCQSWTEQCPHRHTMNTTYPELNNAKNHCRNPQNSGQRPWCFTTDRNKRWEYCDIPKCKPVDGKYGNWSLNSTCNVTCGEGFEIWTRKCIYPEPKRGGRNCSHLGEPIEKRPCIATKLCPVDGKYGKWSLSSTCNVTCGEGFEIWTRKCNNPEPKRGGRNCSHLGKPIEKRPCIATKLCPDSWEKVSPCSVTCGEGVEVWKRRCATHRGKSYRNCSEWGATEEFRSCKLKPCSASKEKSRQVDYQVLGATVGVSALVVIVAITFCIITVRRKRRDRDSSYYAMPNFSSEQ